MSYVLPSRDVGSLEPELRLVLLGTIGCGKTLTGDTLLGTPPSSYASVSSSSRLCQVRRGMSAGRRLTVVEAPRWYWSGGHMEDDVRKETERALDLCAPGPHVFLLLVPVGQFTEVEQRVPAELEEVFGKGVLDHTLVLLTCGDYLMGKEVGHYLEREDPGLREVIDRCGGQYHVINNRRSQERDQVRELLEKVENMVQKKSGCYIKQNTLLKEREELAKAKEREELAKEKEREELAREKERKVRTWEKEREEREMQKEREELAKAKEREELAKGKEREELAREKERKVRTWEKEREEREMQKEREELAKAKEREELAKEKEREELAREKERKVRTWEKEREEREMQKEREELARKKNREEIARQKEREEIARGERKREELAREELVRKRNREELAWQKEREEIARERKREELARAEQERQKEREELTREEQERQKEREELARARKREELAREQARVERASERPRELRPENAEMEVEQEKRERVLESSHAPSAETRRYWGSRPSDSGKSSTERRMEEMQKRIEDNRRQMEAEKEMSDETVRRSGSEGMGQRRDETENRRELMEERVTAKPVAKSLYSTPRPHQQPSEPQNGGPPVFTRTPSFNLNKEGALLSQLSEVKPEQTKKVVNTIYHRVNSFEMDTASSQRSSSTSPLVSTDSSHFSPLFSPGPPSFAELRMVMIGRSGSGKSAAGNVLLGRREFVSLSDSSAPVTQDCQKGRAIVAGRQVAVVDTPDWFNSDAPQELVHSQLSSCVALTAPGPHAFLFCVPVDQPAHAELKALDALEKVFGPKAVRLHTLLLFTHADRLKGSGKASGGRVDEVEKYISTQRRDLLELVERCGDRYHVMEREARAGGGAKEQNRSVEELLEKVQRTVTEGGGGCYSCTLFQEAEDRVRQRQRELVRERRGAEGGERLSSPSMQPLTETEEEEVDQEVMERTREEAERSVAQMELKDLPTFYSPPSFLGSLWDTVGKVGAKTMGAIPRSVWGKETENLPSIPTAAQSSSSLPSSAQSSSSLPSSTQSSSFLRSVLEKVAAGASRIPKLTAAGGLLGAVLGVFLGGPVGGAVGATAGSVATEAARWKLSKNSPEKTGLNPGLERQMDKLLKTE